MEKNLVRQRLLNGEPTLGAFLSLGSPHIAELMASAGLDWLLLEAEHTAIDIAQIEHMLMAVRGTGTVPIVRTLSSDPLLIQKTLDAGAMGVFVPMVRSAAEARAIVQATRYPPEGTRGFGPLRASQYTLDYEDYLASANDNILVVLIIETVESVENIEAILDVPGVDVVYFGLFDLCIAMGLNPMQMPFPEIDEIVERTLKLCKEKGVAIGAGARTPDDLKQLLDRGYTFVNYGMDVQILKDKTLEGIQTFRAHCGDGC